MEGKHRNGLAAYRRRLLTGLALIPAVLVLVAATSEGDPPLERLPGPPDRSAIEYPAGQPPTAEEIALGRQLFFDPRLSGTGTFSCATCHDPAKGLGDGRVTGVGVHGDVLPRNTPTLYHLAWNGTFFWDGRAASLEEQALGPITNPKEMDQTEAGLVARLNRVPAYRAAFARLSPEGLSASAVARVLAAFERTLVVEGTAYDRWRAGQDDALTPSQRRGLRVFFTTARCDRCHSGSTFSDESFHHLGRAGNDPGRAQVFQGATLHGAFKTPGLRNVALTGPYFHDGGIATLDEVVAYYDRGGDRAAGQDPLIRPLHLSADERTDLVAFLGALTAPVEVTAPELPPDEASSDP